MLGGNVPELNSRRVKTDFSGENDFLFVLYHNRAKLKTFN